MRRNLWICVIAVLAMASPSFAQTKPDFSGTWKLNVQKSDFGPVPGPTAQTDVIEQKGDTIKIHVTAEGEQGNVQYTETLTTDGKEVAISPDAAGAHPAPEVTMQSIAASWDGAALKVTQKLTYGSDPVSGVSNYTLSADGKALTIASDYQSQMGDASRTFVFDKADSSSMAAGGNSSGNLGSGAVPSAPSGMAASADSSSSSASTSSSAKPNLSGTWVLDISKSDFGPIPAPSSRTDTIEQNGSSIKFSVSQSTEMGDMNFKLDLVDDGKTIYTWQIMGSDAKSTAHWEGSTLVTQTNTNIQGGDMQIISRYQLAPDGKTLTVNGHVSGAMGDADTKLVFNKK